MIDDHGFPSDEARAAQIARDKAHDSRSCGCDRSPIEPHTCPYLEEMGGDDISLCTCCESCTRACTEDI